MKTLLFLLLSISAFGQSHFDYYRMRDKPDNWLEIVTSRPSNDTLIYNQSGTVVVSPITVPVQSPTVIYMQPLVAPQPYRHAEIIRSFNGNFVNTEIRTPYGTTNSITILPNPTPVIRRP